METASNDGQGGPDLVFGDVGGWISGPSLDAEQLGGPSPDTGRPAGEPITAATLDDLAVLVDHREAHPDTPADG